MKSSTFTSSFFQLSLVIFVASSCLLLATSQVHAVHAPSSEVPSTEHAADTILRMTAIPPRLGEDFSLKASPGQTIQTSVRIKNTSSEKQTFKTTVEDFIIGDDGKEPVPVTEETSSQWSLAKWMTITPPINTIEPNASATINVLIEVPEDAAPGGRYGMIMHAPATDFSIGGAAAGIDQKVGTLVYFMVEGDINEEAFIRNVENKNFFENGPIPVSFVIDNQSDIHIRPVIDIEITNMLGQKVDTLALETNNIFPYSNKKFSTTWDKTWGIGKYTMKISALYGSQSKILQYSLSFWMFPIRLFVAILVGSGLLITVIILIRNTYIKNSVIKNQQIKMLEDKIQNMESQKVQKFTDTQN